MQQFCAHCGIEFFSPERHCKKCGQGKCSYRCTGECHELDGESFVYAVATDPHVHPESVQPEDVAHFRFPIVKETDQAVYVATSHILGGKIVKLNKAQLFTEYAEANFVKYFLPAAVGLD